MPLLTETQVRQRAQKTPERLYKSFDKIILESTASFSEYRTYDIFLSHSIRDAEFIVGVKGILEDLGYSVYVDWLEDPQLDRTKVTRATAKRLKQRMDKSKSLFYVTTENSENSKWMPWECGYFDGAKEKAAILPVKQYSFDDEYEGREYLGLYPYCVKTKDRQGDEKLWVHLDKQRYTLYDYWVETPNKSIEWRKD